MTNQELLECIAPYLPYELKCIYGSELLAERITKIYADKMAVMTDVGGGFIYNYKYILRPLSDLVNPCLENNLIPLIEISRPFVNNGNLEICAHGVETTHCEDGNAELMEYFNYSHENGFHFKIFDFKYTSDCDKCNIIRALKGNQLLLFQQLFKWHFDVFGLIEKGHAIDINTLKI